MATIKNNPTMSSSLTHSLEDYLEAIHCLLESEKKVARVRDIASTLKISKASVTGALRALSERQLINYTPYDVITLTEEGRKVATEIFYRHQILKEFFMKGLLLEEAESESLACKMEHIISKKVIERFVHLVDFLSTCPKTKLSCHHEKRCDECLITTLEKKRVKKNVKRNKRTTNKE